MEANQTQEVTGVRLREMACAANTEKRRKRGERIEVFNRVNDRFHDWVTNHREPVFELQDGSFRARVDIQVVRFEDGQWMGGYTVNLPDRGVGSGISPMNECYPNRDAAFKAELICAMQYLLGEAARNDVSKSLAAHIRKLFQASAELVFGGKLKQSTLF